MCKIHTTPTSTWSMSCTHANDSPLQYGCHYLCKQWNTPASQ